MHSITLAQGPVCGLGFVSILLAITPVAGAQVVPYGSGVNPPGSLVLTSGIPKVGESFTVGVSNPTSPNAPDAWAYLSLALDPDPAFPAGTVLPGFGLAAPGAPGEVLIRLTPPNPVMTLGPMYWAGGTAPPAQFSVAIPLLPALTGRTVYMQGSLLRFAGVPTLGVTNGLAVTLAEPDIKGMVLIQPGTFQMGSNAAGGEPYFGTDYEKPVHQVTISKPFWMGRFEVTQAEYQALMGTNPSFFLGADRPVDTVTWFDALAYCDALNVQQSVLGMLPEGYEYRLPTEAEWEYVCRAGTGTEFHYGTELLCTQAKFWYALHSNRYCHLGWSGTATVGTYAPNAWGVYDMHGNVTEWCMDSYEAYTASAKTDPYVTGGWNRVFRGGGWESISAGCRASRRDLWHPAIPSVQSGFRVVLAPSLVF